MPRKADPVIDARRYLVEAFRALEAFLAPGAPLWLWAEIFGTVGCAYADRAPFRLSDLERLHKAFDAAVDAMEG
ncbi:MAG TPA: hypothetical protein VMH86_17560 [Rhizomicrobium sp.]|nr:hypothetical protein [Rhizomicrobium sp.]